MEDADVPPKRARRLLYDARLPGLPAETPEHHLAVLIAPHPVRPPRDAVAVSIIGVGAFQDVGFRDGFEQTHADNGRGDARRQHRIAVQRPVMKTGDTVCRAAQGDHFPTGQRDRRFFVADRHFPLGAHALHREIL